MIKIKYVLLVLLVLRVAAPLTLAGYMWQKNRNKDVSSNFDIIFRRDYIRALSWRTPFGVPSRFPNNRYLYS